jgi:hypothetical protein
MVFRSSKFREARARSLGLSKSFLLLPKSVQERIVLSERKFVKKLRK